jgi:hypothetical protein
MTVCVGGYWEAGWDVPRLEYDRWQFMLKEFGVDELHMAPISGIMAGTTQTFLTEHQNLEALIVAARAAGKTVVFVDEAAEISLPDFDHPADVLYLTGRTTLSVYAAYFSAEQGDVAVKVPTMVNQGGFWAHQAMALVLYDRYLKQA